MKISLQILLGCFLVIGLGSFQEGHAQESTRLQVLSQSTMTKKEPVLRHVVLFAFKESSSESDVRRIEEAFSDLPAKIPQIKDYEWGTNNSPEGLNDGLTHCFLVTFASEEDRAIYLPHPEHKAFVDILRPHLEKAVVVDYWTNE